MSAVTIMAVLQSALRGFFRDLITRATTLSLSHKANFKWFSPDTNLPDPITTKGPPCPHLPFQQIWHKFLFQPAPATTALPTESFSAVLKVAKLSSQWGQQQLGMEDSKLPDIVQRLQDLYPILRVQPLQQCLTQQRKEKNPHRTIRLEPPHKPSN